MKFKIDEKNIVITESGKTIFPIIADYPLDSYFISEITKDERVYNKIKFISSCYRNRYKIYDNLSFRVSASEALETDLESTLANQIVLLEKHCEENPHLEKDLIVRLKEDRNAKKIIKNRKNYLKQFKIIADNCNIIAEKLRLMFK